jgi:hypothetical protein
MIVVRDMTPGDRAYVLSTWVESEEEHARLQVPRDDAFRALRAKATRLLDRSRCVVAAPEDDAITVLGWMCADVDRGLVHYAYTRRAVRRSGIARSLAEHLSIGAIRATCRAPRHAIEGVHHDPILGWVLAVMETT